MTKIIKITKISKLLNKLNSISFILFNPQLWILNYEYDENWDKELNELIDNGFELKDYFGETTKNTPWGSERRKIPIEDITSLSLNGHSVWVSNYPYGYATINNFTPKTPKRPSRRTIKRLRKYIKNHKITNPEFYL